MPKLIRGFETAGHKKTGNEPEMKIEVNLNKGQTLMIADDTLRRTVKDPSVKYTGKYLFKTGFELTIGVDTGIKRKPKLEEGDIVFITYTDQKFLFSFNAVMTGVRKASPDSSGVKYIFDIIPITTPEKQQRREFYRINLSTDILYYKKTETGEGIETEIKMKTLDLSAGGFRAKSKTPIKSGSVLECTVAIGHEALPVSVKILSAKQEDINDTKNGLYDVRAIFYDMSDQIRDRIVRYIFARQRQVHASRSIIKIEEEIK